MNLPKILELGIELSHKQWEWLLRLRSSLAVRLTMVITKAVLPEFMVVRGSQGSRSVPSPPTWGSGYSP